MRDAHETVDPIHFKRQIKNCLILQKKEFRFRELTMHWKLPIQNFSLRNHCEYLNIRMERRTWLKLICQFKLLDFGKQNFGKALDGGILSLSKQSHCRKFRKTLYFENVRKYWISFCNERKTFFQRFLFQNLLEINMKLLSNSLPQ